MKSICLVIFSIGANPAVQAQQLSLNSDHSIARTWNEALLFAIRNDLARPTVHARNLFHSAAVTWDAWSVFDEVATPWLLGRSNAAQTPCSFSAAQRRLYQREAADVDASRQVVISFANYRLLTSRFNTSPGAARSLVAFNTVMNQLGLDTNNTSTDITTGSMPALGNHLAECMIAFGHADGSNEQNGYKNRYYEPVNPPLNPTRTRSTITDPNRWQSLQLATFIDQSGFQSETPEFLGAEWGHVRGFSLDAADQTSYQRSGRSYPVYHDPGPPALLPLNSENAAGQLTDYSWGHSLVALWSAHLDHTDGVMLDSSPATLGSTENLPQSFSGLRDFFNDLEGGTITTGHAMNPATGQPYKPNPVLRGDYTRVLAEFWADGPDSETPPGHWFSMYNSFVADHPDFSRRLYGRGAPLSPLDFDVIAYFTLGAAMHDAAITAWSIKGWYDYVRPLSALRYLATIGQATDITAANYDPLGIPLVTGRIEQVTAVDPLAATTGNIGKIKVRAWRGPGYISNSATDVAGVGWVLLENWWPYQRATFVTPPFAGYVSGHSTFSRAAAEVLSAITGDAYFPGGMAEFVAKKDEFLKFERGPSTDVRLQWATYRDASDQTGLSRIWGGIHPPVDDIPGRIAGITVARNVLDRVALFADGTAPDSDNGLFNSVTETESGGGCVLRYGPTTVDPLLLLILFTCVGRLTLQRKNGWRYQKPVR